MTLEQLRVFIVVAEHEHVTRASYALDMVQSAVSKVVATLEGEIAIRLFDRVGRNIRLTPLGAAFRERAQELLDHADLLQTWTREVGTRVEHTSVARALRCEPGVVEAALRRPAAILPPKSPASITRRDQSDRMADLRHSIAGITNVRNDG